MSNFTHRGALQLQNPSWSLCKNVSVNYLKVDILSIIQMNNNVNQYSANKTINVLKLTWNQFWNWILQCLFQNISFCLCQCLFVIFVHFPLVYICSCSRSHFTQISVIKEKKIFWKCPFHAKLKASGNKAISDADCPTFWELATRW